MARPEDIARGLRSLGVDLERIEPTARELADWFEQRGVEGVTRIALLRLCDLATRYSEARVDGPGFNARADAVVALLTDGDKEAASEMELEFN